MADCRTPLLWIDADATILSYPVLFDEPPFVFGVGVRKIRSDSIKPAHRERMYQPKNWPAGEEKVWFNAGTIYLGVDALVDEMLDRWVELTEADPIAWDQWTLQQAWADWQPKACWLPWPYCEIRNRSGKAVISHDMVSSKLKVARS